MRKTALRNNEDLWADFISGNDQSFRMMYDSYIQPLFKYGCRFTSDTGLVQDSIHDLFIDLYSYRTRLGVDVNVKSYLFVSLKRNIVKKLNNEKKLKPLDIENIPFDFSFTIENVDEKLEAQKTECLKKAMTELSARQREAIYLKFVSGLDYQELCEILNINYQVARNLIYKGMEKLRTNCRKKLADYIVKND